MEPASARDGDLVKAAQTLLRALGYTASRGRTLDTRTRAAIEQFQRAQGLDVTGGVTPQLIVHLADALANRCTPLQ